jgi:PHD/YefM family antitoxin component YafN of YafNO toxin-antitoxin module
MIEPPSPSVTAAEAVRNFATLRQRASGAPVFITHHGRAAHVLCSAEQFRALAGRQGSREGGAASLDMAQLAAWIDRECC